MKTAATAVALLVILLAPPAWAQTPPECRTWEECRALALDAEASGAFEAFHDLAWRTMQTRGRNDPEVMEMLARAQARSGRPHDALVMLRRIAEMGVPPADALTADAFTRTRALPDWPAVQTLIEGAASADTGGTPGEPAGAGVAVPVPPERPAAASGDGVPASAGTAARADEPTPGALAPEVLLKLGRGNVVPGGLAYDAASGRVLVGNRHGRSVITISERLKTSMDLVRASSAGFHEVLALAIDARRGDLWVASASGFAGSETSADESGAALHKLQLVSGRPLTRIPINTGDRPARFTGLAVTRSGAVFVLDGETGRLWTLPPGARALTLVTQVALQNPSALAIDDRRGHAYVAHDEGLARVTLGGGAVTPVTAPDASSVSGVETLSWYKGSLVGLQRTARSSRRLVRWRLDAAGTAVVKAEDVDPDVPTCAGGSAASVSGDEVYYLAADAQASASEGACQIVVRRSSLP